MSEHISWVGATVALAPSGSGCTAGSGGPTAVHLTAFTAAPSAARTPFLPFVAGVFGLTAVALHRARKRTR
ncbi:hypothetical protein [Ardenticatena maritima]|uniref:hypothetical protein n=1 Tax=Ardenticatena maritima TaxID=872965 RepID=UPI00128FB7AF|nr:hypothetical protein [Ardenticatena maritima]